MRIGLVAGCWDLLHAGHCLLFKDAKEYCDQLIVCLQTDPTIDRPGIKNSPVQTLYERYIQLEAIKYVDKIVPYQTEQELLDILKTNKLDVRFIGADYLGEEFTGKDYCLKNDIEIHYIQRDHEYSTSELRKRTKNSS